MSRWDSYQAMTDTSWYGYRTRKDDTSAVLTRFRRLWRWSILFDDQKWNVQYVSLSLQTLARNFERCNSQLKFATRFWAKIWGYLTFFDFINQVISLLFLIFFYNEVYQWDLERIDMTQAECGHRSELQSWINPTFWKKISPDPTLASRFVK